MPEAAKNEPCDPRPPIEPETAEIQVSRRDLDRLLDLIENPPEPSEELKRMARQYNDTMSRPT